MGYKKQVNERGSRLSVGQRQLISFARALLADPKILILDEATSSIDTRTEQALQLSLIHILEDRFGQYGIIGVCFLRSGDGNVWIDQFCISCRVGGRGIGVVFLQTVLDQCQGMGNPCFKAVCCFTPTKRNRPVVILLRTLGFRKSQSQDGQGGLEVALPVAHVACDWITIIVDKG